MLTHETWIIEMLRNTDEWQGYQARHATMMGYRLKNGVLVRKTPWGVKEIKSVWELEAPRLLPHS